MTPEQEKALALAKARRRRQEAQGVAPTVENAVPLAEARMDELSKAASVAYSSGDDARGQELLAEASRLSIDAGIAPQGTSYDPATGTMPNLRDAASPYIPETSRGRAVAMGGMQGLGFNFGDEAVAGAYGLMDGQPGAYEFGLDRIREEERRLTGKYPFSHGAAKIAGAVASSLSGGKALGLTGKVSTGGGAVRGAGIGATEGGLAGFGAGEGGLENRLREADRGAKFGALAGGVIAPLAGAGVDKVAQALANRRAIADAIRGAPTTEQLRSAGNAAYQAVDDAGVVVRPEAFAGMVDDVTGTMRRGGLDEGMGSLTPQSSRVTEIFEDAATKPRATGVPFSEIDLLRRKAGVPAANMSTPLESRLGMQAIEGVDDFIGKLTPDQVMSGDASALPGLITKARETWSRMSKSQMIDDAMEASGNYLSGSAAGIKNQFSRILKSEKLSRGFSEMERAAMRRVVNGTVPEKVLNLFSGGLGQMATMGMGAGLGGLPGFLAGTGIAVGSRKGAEALAGRNAEIVRALVASGKAGAEPTISNIPRSIAEALMRRAGVVGQ